MVSFLPKNEPENLNFRPRLISPFFGRLQNTEIYFWNYLTFRSSHRFFSVRNFVHIIRVFICYDFFDCKLDIWGILKLFGESHYLINLSTTILKNFLIFLINFMGQKFLSNHFILFWILLSHFCLNTLTFHYFEEYLSNFVIIVNTVRFTLRHKKYCWRMWQENSK